MWRLGGQEDDFSVAHPKPLQAGIERHIPGLELPDPRKTWARSQLPNKLFEGLARTLRVQLHRAVRQVAHPALKAEGLAAALGEEAVSDPLDDTIHPDPQGPQPPSAI